MTTRHLAFSVNNGLAKKFVLVFHILRKPERTFSQPNMLQAYSPICHTSFNIVDTVFWCAKIFNI